MAKRLKAITVHVRHAALSVLLAPAVLSRIQFYTLKQFSELTMDNSFCLSDVHASCSEPNWLYPTFVTLNSQFFSTISLLTRYG